MTAPIRDRIEARRAALLSERAIAEAATPGPWPVSTFHNGNKTTWGVGDRWIVNAPMIADRLSEADATHIAAQDPAATLARVDRELGGIDADLALLDLAYLNLPWPSINDNLNARYPEDDQ